MIRSLHRCLVVIATGLVLTGCGLGGEAARSTASMSELLDVDKEFTGPPMPDLKSKQTVSSIYSQGVLLLDDDRRIALAGLECSPKMYSYMQALFFGNEPDFLVYLPSGYVVDDLQYAYVWAVTLWELGDPDLEFSPATSSLNETGLLSGWCEPVEQDSHSYHGRFVAISSPNN